jgi:hypothetical protein
MATVVAVDKDSLHGALGLWVKDSPHASILPGVLNGIGKDDIGAIKVKAAKLFVVIVDLGLRILNTAEDSFAEG